MLKLILYTFLSWFGNLVIFECIWIFNNEIKRLYDILINVLKSHYSGMRMVAFLLHNICVGGTVYCNYSNIKHMANCPPSHTFPIHVHIVKYRLNTWILQNSLLQFHNWWIGKFQTKYTYELIKSRSIQCHWCQNY